MKIIKFLTIIIFIAITTIQNKSSANVRNQFALKAGMGVARTNVTNREKDELIGPTFKTKVGYHFKNFSFKLVSEISIAELDDFSFGENQFIGNANFRSVSYGTRIRYTTNYSPYSKWYLYFAAGPVLAVQELVFKNEMYESEEYKSEEYEVYKIVYCSKGYGLTIGAETSLKYIKTHPIFIEISYIALKAYKISVIDISNSTKTKSISVEYNKETLRGRTILLNIGIKLF